MTQDKDNLLFIEILSYIIDSSDADSIWYYLADDLMETPSKISVQEPS